MGKNVKRGCGTCKHSALMVGHTSLQKSKSSKGLHTHSLMRGNNYSGTQEFCGFEHDDRDTFSQGTDRTNSEIRSGYERNTFDNIFDHRLKMLEQKYSANGQPNSNKFANIEDMLRNESVKKSRNENSSEIHKSVRSFATGEMSPIHDSEDAKKKRDELRKRINRLLGAANKNGERNLYTASPSISMHEDDSYDVKEGKGRNYNNNELFALLELIEEELRNTKMQLDLELKKNYGLTKDLQLMFKSLDSAKINMDEYSKQVKHLQKLLEEKNAKMGGLPQENAELRLRLGEMIQMLVEFNKISLVFLNFYKEIMTIKDSGFSDAKINKFINQLLDKEKDVMHRINIDVERAGEIISKNEVHFNSKHETRRPSLGSISDKSRHPQSVNDVGQADTYANSLSDYNIDKADRFKNDLENMREKYNKLLQEYYMINEIHMNNSNSVLDGVKQIVTLKKENFELRDEISRLKSNVP